MASVRRNYNLQDRFPTVLLITLGTFAVLLAVSAIPTFHLNDMEVRRTNVLSPFTNVDDDQSTSTATSEWIEDGSLYRSYAESEMMPVPEELQGLSDEPMEAVSDVADSEMFIETASPMGGIEEYGESGIKMDRFMQDLLHESKNRNIRIAFLGDSFIEGDILTASLRSELQTAYGGEGVGFVPFADPIARYRGTVKQDFSGWSCYNLLRKNSAPEKVQGDFYISGYVSVPAQGAYATFRSGSYKGRVLTSSRARILFKNRAEGVMDVIINKNDTLRYDLQVSNDVQCIDITDNRIAELTVRLPKCDDFVGYGVVFEGRSGVNLDNYGLRSHRGTNLLTTASDVNFQIGQLLDYDLIVMEYGLNAMQKTVTQYGSYYDRMKKTIEYVRRSFPNSAIMILSVGDVGMQVDGKIVTAPAVQAMVDSQRALARQCQVSFWNMFVGMGGPGSMKLFVDKGWANKDYLHINSRGGEQLARILYDTMMKNRVHTDSQEKHDEVTINI